MGLKTLKDFPLYKTPNPRFVEMEELRQEAIRWIKEMWVFKKTEEDNFFDEFMGRKTIYSEEGKQAIINFIRYFFNIKEEDLK